MKILDNVKKLFKYHTGILNVNNQCSYSSKLLQKYLICFFMLNNNVEIAS